MISRLAEWAATRKPWSRVGLAIVLGAVSALALPPFQIFPLLWLIFPLLLWLLDGVKGGRGAFAVGWGFGFGFFGAGLHWIAYAFFVDAETYGWMAPPAIAGLAAGLALFHGLTLLLVHLTKTRGIGRVLVFASLWTLAEMVRGTILTGFPWNPLAAVWMNALPVLQSVAWIGATGLSLITAAAAATPAVLGWPGQRRATPALAALIVLAAIAGLGAWRVPTAPMPLVPKVNLRIVQPSIPQSQKWQDDTALANLREYIDMSRNPVGANDGIPPPTAVIWGETAVPYALDGVDREIETALGRSLPQATVDGVPAVLITGVVRRTPVGGKMPFQVWNSMEAFTADGKTVGTYDKAHLVPFGEYMPLHWLIPIKAMATEVDYTAGPGPKTLDLPGLPPVGPLICYEIIFPGAVVDPARRPDWLVSLTNDGWYGMSTGPYQHFALARLRGMEEGLPVVRASNTGISGVIDPYGRIITRIGLGVVGIADSPLPKPLPPTLFARGGQWIPLVLALIAGGLGLALGRRRAA